MHKVFMSLSEDAEGYPNLAFEVWYQQGMSCYMARMPKSLRKQAFKHLVCEWQTKGLMIAMWQIRAFVHGTNGKDLSGQRTPHVSDSYSWPTPPDASWRLVVCVYSDTEYDLDFVHPVSRKFWSEDNGFLALPEVSINVFRSSWFVNMGFEVMYMQPIMHVVESRPLPHLRII